jgi:hypothetical protein
MLSARTRAAIAALGFSVAAPWVTRNAQCCDPNEFDEGGRPLELGRQKAVGKRTVDAGTEAEADNFATAARWSFGTLDAHFGNVLLGLPTLDDLPMTLEAPEARLQLAIASPSVPHFIRDFGVGLKLFGTDPSAERPAPEGPVQFPSPSLPADSGVRGFEVGLRVGYSIPLGSIDGDSASPYNSVLPTFFKGAASTEDGMGTLFSGRVPIWADVGYRINSHFLVGGFLEYGVVALSGAASQACGGCPARDWTTGLEAQYHVLPEERFDPWVGLGVGYEWVNVGRSGPFNPTVSLDGWQFSLQSGVDYKPMTSLGIGPFVALAFGAYANEQGTTWRDVNGPMAFHTGPNFDHQTTVHEWLTLGLRGGYDIRL